jgi:hypothetical protein
LTFSGADAIYRLSLLFSQQKFKAGNSPKPTNCREKQPPTQKKKQHPEIVPKKQKAKNEEEEDGRRQQYLL